jgi:hypothetical protein
MVKLFPGVVAHVRAPFKYGQANGSTATAIGEEMDIPVIWRLILVVYARVVVHFLVCYSPNLSRSNSRRLWGPRSYDDNAIVALVPDYRFGFQWIRQHTVNDLIMVNAV